jgi:hypothetical protein
MSTSLRKVENPEKFRSNIRSKIDEIPNGLFDPCWCNKIKCKKTTATIKNGKR